MHGANGLLTAIGVTGRRAPDIFPDNVLTVAAVQRRVIDLLHGHGVRKGLVHLAGSGVAAFDRPFLARHMPQLHAYLHYAPIDVGVLRRTWQMWTGNDLVTVNQDKTHRALDDARCHLAEATAFRRVFAAAAHARGLPIPADRTDPTSTTTARRSRRRPTSPRPDERGARGERHQTCPEKPGSPSSAT